MSFFKKSKKNTEKSATTVDMQVDTDVSTSSARESGTGQLEKLVNKGGTVHVDNSCSTININLLFNGKNDEEKKQIIHNIFAEFRNHGSRLVGKNSANEVAEYNSYARSSDDNILVDFFHDKIPSLDLQILKTGLYIQDLVRRGMFDEAKRVKANAVRANGRAANIINLTTSGYMGDYMRPVFEANDLVVAQAHYDEVVTYLPEIIFVRNEMTESDVMSQIDAKIARRAQYHVVVVKRIIVTGIGSGCVKVIEKVKSMVEQKYQYPDYEVGFSTSSGTMPQAKLQIILKSKL